MARKWTHKSWFKAAFGNKPKKPSGWKTKPKFNAIARKNSRPAQFRKFWPNL